MLEASRRRPFRPGGLLSSPTQPPGPTPGTAHRPLVRDTATDRIGEVMEETGSGQNARVWLRPPGGGREWTTTAEDIQPVEDAA